MFSSTFGTLTTGCLSTSCLYLKEISGQRVRYLTDRIRVSSSQPSTTLRRENCSNILRWYEPNCKKWTLTVRGPHISPFNPRNPPHEGMTGQIEG
jgi:hypothetical protein